MTNHHAWKLINIILLLFNSYPFQFLLFFLSIEGCPLIRNNVHVMTAIDKELSLVFLLPFANLHLQFLFNLKVIIS